MDAAAKQRMREAMKERFFHIPERARQTESRILCKRLQELFKNPPPVLAAFFPLATEPDIRPFLRHALAAGIELYLPAAGEKKFSLRRITSFNDLRVGPWNIPEPRPGLQELDPKHLQYALIPGRAFDREGWRIGRGGAGYDIWIRSQRSQNPATIFWGIAFECQVLCAVPHEDHDERLDGIVTARGMFPSTDKGGGSPPLTHTSTHQ